MMDGRVKTLHPAIHGGILARRHRPDDLEAIRGAGHRARRSRRRQPLSVREGGAEPRHAVRRAGRGDRHRRAEPAARRREELPRRPRRRRSGGLSEGARRAGAPGRAVARVPLRADEEGVRAHGAVRRHDRDDAGASSRTWTADAITRRSAPVHASRSRETSATARTRTRRRPGCPFPAELGRGWEVHQGKELSYTNLLDLDAALRIVLEFTEPAAVVIKHTNPCGVATGDGDRGGLRSRARGGSALGLRRHRRPQSPDRRGDREGADVHVHRSGDRASRSTPTRSRSSA